MSVKIQDLESADRQDGLLFQAFKDGVAKKVSLADLKSLHSGTGAPGGGVGIDGDFYIDVTTYDFYGPKTSGAWGSAETLSAVLPQPLATDSSPTFDDLTLAGDLDVAGNAVFGSGSVAAAVSIYGGSTSSDHILALNARFKFRGDGALDWGDAANYGVLSWDTGKAIVGARSGKALELHANNAAAASISTGGVFKVNNLAGSGVRLVTANATGELGNATTVAGDYAFSGNMGVGGAPALARFRVYGGSDLNSGLTLGDGGSDVPTMGFHVSDGTKRARIQVNNVNGSYGDRLAFSAFHSGTLSEVLNVLGIQRVGILTTTPATTLDVNGTMAVSGASTLAGLLTASAGAAVTLGGAATTGLKDVASFTATSTGTTDATFGARILLYTENSNGNLWPAGLAAVNSGSGSNLSDLAFYTATAGPTLTERVRITSGGAVGIGASSPAKRLHVTTNSTSDPDVARFQNLGSTGDSYLDIGIGYPGMFDDYVLFRRNGTTVFGLDASNRLEIQQVTQISSNKQIQSLANANNRINLSNASADFDIGYLNNLVFQSSTTEVMRVTSTGRLGIGTASPAYTLDVYGDAYISGAMRIGELYYSPLFTLSMSVASERWVKLATIPNNHTVRFQLRTGSQDSEEMAEVKVYGTYYVNQTGVTVERQTYNEHLREVRVTGTDGGAKTVYVRIRASNYSSSMTWRVIESKGSVTIHNTEETPSGGLAHLVSGNLVTSMNSALTLAGLAGTGARLVTAASTGELGNASTVAGNYIFSGNLDASQLTVDLAAIGSVSVSSTRLLSVGGLGLSGATTRGLLIEPTVPSSTVGQFIGAYVIPNSPNTSFTTGEVIGMRVEFEKGASHVITTYYGLKIENPPTASTAYALHTGTGSVRFGSLTGTGARLVTAASTGELGNATTIAGNYTLSGTLGGTSSTWSGAMAVSAQLTVNGIHPSSHSFSLIGAEGQAAFQYMYADEADDDADKWSLSAETDGTWRIKAYATGVPQTALSISSSTLGVSLGGSLDVNASVTFAGLAGTGTRLVTSISTGQLNNATTIAGAYTWSDAQAITASYGGAALIIRNTDATNGYGLAVESEGTASTRYALIIRNLGSSVIYGGVSTATGQVGYWGIGVSPTSTLGNRLTVSGGASIGASYTATAAPSNGMIIQGNVGIGTSAPAARLEIHGSNANADTRALTLVNGAGGSGDSVTLQFSAGSDPTVTTGSSLIRSARQATSGNHLEFWTSPGVSSAAVKRVTIGKDGNFDVAGRTIVNSDGVVLWGSAADHGILTWDTGKAMVGGVSGKALELYADNSAKASLSTAGAFRVHNLGNGSTTRLVTATSDGTLGNATTISGNYTFSGAVTFSDSAQISKSINGDTEIGIQNANTGTSARSVLRWSNNTSSAAIAYHSSTHATSPRDLLIANNDAAGSIKFLFNGAVGVTLHESGKVGIGTASPSDLFTVAGGFSVNEFGHMSAVGGSFAGAVQVSGENGNDGNRFGLLVTSDITPYTYECINAPILSNLSVTGATTSSRGALFYGEGISSAPTLENAYGVYIEELTAGSNNFGASFGNPLEFRFGTEGGYGYASPTLDNAPSSQNVEYIPCRVNGVDGWLLWLPPES